MKDFTKFSKIYSYFKDKIFNYFLFRTNFEKDLSEDLTEEVFEKVINNLDSLNDEGNFKVWIYRIAHNLLVDYFKKKKEIYIVDDINEDIDLKVKRVDENDIDFIIDSKIKTEKIKKAINELNDTDKNLITLKFIDDLDYEEMEMLLNKNKIAIRTGVSRALKKLKDLLDN